MTSIGFDDPCPNLSLAVDIAGDKYFLGTDRPVELGYKSRRDFINAFGDNSDVMCLLRKYMSFGSNPLKTVFDSEDERNALIRILETRASTLKNSNQFNSSVLASTIIQRNYLNLLRVIEGLKGEPYKPRDWGISGKLAKLKGALPKPSIITPTSTYKAYAEALTDDQKVQLVLEMAWFLLHPELVPKKAERRWFKLVKRLDTLRLNDMMGLSTKIQEITQNNPGKPFINYFKTLNLKKLMDISGTNLNTLDNMTLDHIFMMGCEQEKEIIKQRLHTILNLLAAKRYLTEGDIQLISELGSVENNNEIDEKMSDLSGSLVINPGSASASLSGGGSCSATGILFQTGGAEEQEMSKGLRKGLVPFFDYFSGMYDPVYGVLDKAIDEMESKPNVEELVRLFNIISKINPENDPKKYGIYRINGLEKPIHEFVRVLIKSTEFHTDKLSDNDKKEYLEDLSVLPRIRLSSVVNQFSSTYKDPDTLPFISLMLVGAGITIPDEDTIEDPNKGFIRKSMDSHGVSSANKTLSSLNFGQVTQAIQEFFTDNGLYIICNSEKDKLPLVLYDIDINSVKLEDTVVSGVLLENNYFNKLTVGNDPLYLDDLLNVDNQNILNEAVFALAIFISLKDLFRE